MDMHVCLQFTECVSCHDGGGWWGSACMDYKCRTTALSLGLRTNRTLGNKPSNVDVENEVVTISAGVR